MRMAQGWVGSFGGSVRRTGRTQYEAVKVGTSMAAIRTFRTERDAREWVGGKSS